MTKWTDFWRKTLILIQLDRSPSFYIQSRRPRPFLQPGGESISRLKRWYASHDRNGAPQNKTEERYGQPLSDQALERDDATVWVLSWRLHSQHGYRGWKGNSASLQPPGPSFVTETQRLALNALNLMGNCIRSVWVVVSW